MICLKSNPFEMFIQTSVLKSAFDRDGEMSKVKAMSGIRIAVTPRVSTYILEKKIRKLLEFYASTIKTSEAVSIDRMISKLDRLDQISIEYLYYLCTEESVAKMMELLGRNQTLIASSAIQWKAASTEETSIEEGR